MRDMRPAETHFNGNPGGVEYTFVGLEWLDEWLLMLE
jgi:hypothetical protein